MFYRFDNWIIVIIISISTTFAYYNPYYSQQHQFRTNTYISDAISITFPYDLAVDSLRVIVRFDVIIII
jgi:hypothetical protein